MEYDLMISQMDDHNEAALILCKKYNIKNIFYLINNNDLNEFIYLKGIYKELLPDCHVSFIKNSFNDIEKIKDILLRHKDENILVNLTGGERIKSLVLLYEAVKLNLKCTYIDLLKEKNFIFDSDLNVTNTNFEDLNIEEITKLSGASIINSSSALMYKKDINIIISAILKNIDIWEEYKKRLYDKNIFIHDYKDNEYLRINTKDLTKKELNILFSCLKALRDLSGIDYEMLENSISVKFRNTYLKSFIFKSGTWLEVLTNKIINEISEIDECKSGVEFFWSRDAKRVKNELDVVAVKDCTLLCISCKDSEKYDEDALNELDVYSRKIGGKNVKKILVATKEPVKVTVRERAREMDIHIVIVSGDVDLFKSKLIGIIGD